MGYRTVIAILVCLWGVASAQAYCYEPSFSEDPPDPPGKYYRPDVPYCLAEYSYSGSHTCDSWEIETYKSEVEDYIRKLNDYISEAVDFADEARRFAEEASDFARCEANEVLSQHE